MRTIGVVTGSRSDYGSLLPILHRIQAAPDLRLSVLVTGMHLAPEFGLTVRLIEADGFSVEERIEMLLSSDTPEGIAKSIGLGTVGFAQAYARTPPDLLMVLGDRFEMLPAALAAAPFKIPVAHVHGGELTEGAIDDGFRHAMTKLSHLHFVATDDYARRVMQMGEEPWRVTVSGAPSLDQLRTVRLLTPRELEQRIGLALAAPPLLVTYHPVTLEYEQAGWQAGQLLEAVSDFPGPILFTKPNADTNGRVIIRRLEAFVRQRSNTALIDNLGTQGYFSMMACAAAMLGNSSSGLVEAPSFRLPVVNVGTRQDARVRAANVIDCGYAAHEIRDALQRALSGAFRERLAELRNPYGDGQAARRIVARLAGLTDWPGLVRKRFIDREAALVTTP